MHLEMYKFRDTIENIIHLEMHLKIYTFEDEFENV